MARLPDVHGRRPIPDGTRPFASIRNAGVVGDAVAGLGDAIQGLGHALDGAIEKQRTEEAAAEAGELFTEFSNAEREFFLNPESGFLNTSGSNAVSGRDGAIKFLSELPETLLKGKSERVQKRARPIIMESVQSALGKVDAHVSRERRAWLDDASASVISTAADNAITNYSSEADIARNLAIGFDTLSNRAELLGWPDERLALERENFVSGTLRNVIARRAEFDPIGAMEYAKANAHRLSGDDMAAIEGTVGRAARAMDGETLAVAAWQKRTALPEAIATGDAGQVADALMPALVWQESRGRGTAVGPDNHTGENARGLAQLLPSTAIGVARQLGIRMDEQTLIAKLNDGTPDGNALNVKLGREYLRQQLKRYDNNPVLALAAYNAGPGRVDDWIKPKEAGGLGDPRDPLGPTSAQWAAAIPFKETREYVPAVLSRNGARAAVAEVGDPVAQRAADAKLSELEAKHQIAQEQFLRGFEDELAALQYGVEAPDSKFTREALVEMFDPLDGQALWDQKEAAREHGEVFRSITRASREEIARQHAELSAGTEGPVGFTDAAKRLQQFEAVVRERAALILDDPAAYAEQHFETVRMAADAEEFDPEAYAVAQIGAQKRLGLEDWQIRVMTKEQVRSTVAQITTGPTDEAGARIAALDQAWGDHWPEALEQMRKEGLPDGHYIAGMYVDNPGLAQQIVMATQAGDELKKGLHPEDMNDLEKALADSLAPWREAFEVGVDSGAVAEFNQLASAMEAWALMRFRAGGTDVNRSVSAAINLFLRSKWLDPIEAGSGLLDVGPQINALVPRRIGGRALSEPMVLNAAAQAQTEEAIRAWGPATIGPEGVHLGALDAEGRPLNAEDETVGRKATIAAAANSGLWVTNEAGDGLVLLVPTMGSGVMLPLLKQERGRVVTYEIKFRDMAAAHWRGMPSGVIGGPISIIAPMAGVE